MKEEIRTSLAPLPVACYSQGILVKGTLYVAGQGPVNAVTGEIPEGIEAQTKQVLENIGHILKAAGADFSDVVKVSAYLQNLSDFESYNKVYQEFFPAPYPVRTTVQSGLANILVEIDVIAEL
ncbi:RidA family protein [Neobacillus vireti]|uniref:Uncharacterized protein n=1 Tax=Neobacillus vireti LMG 21834 TaxID=1131730 RepID=A0AB94IT58_9BACI|nr:Rid family detoxifying hydrolase [Neobacillus vireti]ETI70158.1 hypothetical protein BAVI_03694 [Neobacillus vireti LMG 21834]KLT16471.1 endoribonuclease L-PSP [Neobacillus vireti]